MDFSHNPVLFDECMEGLNIKSGGVYLDGTCGGAGHSSGICTRLTEGGRLIGIDRDPEAVAAASERLSEYNAKVVKGNYSDIKDISRSLGIDGYDGILLDLGVSSHQLDCAERGFSFHADAPLDMRMSMEGISAEDVINTYPEEQLSRIIYTYGEEKFAGRIASAVCARRKEKAIKTTGELAEIIKEAVPARFRREKNPCRKTFQAVRIAVNSEFEHLDKGLDEAFDMLNEGGRLCVITFHSLEDRMVKQHFASYCTGCICPPDFPCCVCGRKPRGKLINKKPVTASDTELRCNPRSRSAKLRIIEKLKESE